MLVLAMDISHVYTTHPWLVSIFPDCPRYLTLAYGSRITCPNAQRAAEFTAAIKRGDITWHHAPFNYYLCVM